MARVNPIISSFTAGELSPRLDGRVDLKFYHQGCADLKNMTVWPHGGATKRPGTYHIAEVKTSAKETRLIPFEYSEEQAYIIEAGNLYMRFYKNGGQILDGASPYELVTPYLSADLFDLKFVQSADVLFIVHPSYAPRKLTRTGHTAWTLTEIDFVWGPFRDENTTAITITASALTGSITLTASSALFTADHVGALWKIIGDAVVADSFTSVTASASDQEADAGETLVVSLSDTWVGTCTLERSFDGGATWVAYAAYTANMTGEIASLEDGTLYRWNMTARTSGTCEARLIKTAQSGYVKITAFTSTTIVTATVVETLPTTDAVTAWAEGAWSVSRGYPGAIAFFEQRLVFAGNTSQKQTLWGSVVDDYENHKIGVNASDAWAHTLGARKVNAIKWLEPGDVLHIGTTGGAWRIGATDKNDPLTPTDVNAKQHKAAFGAAAVQPISAGTPLYLQKGGRKLRSLTYKFEDDAWLAPDVSQKAEHLLQDGIVDIAHVDEPDPTIWMVRSDGDLVGCTYDTLNGIAAFGVHDSGAGKFESVAVIPGTDRDELWVIVKRTINGSDVRLVEQFMSPHWTDQEDAFFVDCGFTYDSTATDTISGLDHLEGETVKILADGAPHPDRVVSSGSITLARAYSTVQVGLGYAAKIKTMRIEAGAQAGTAQAKKKKTFRVSVRVHNTLGMNIGPDYDHLDAVVFRTGSDPMDAPPPLFTGDKKDIPFPGGFGTEGHICLTNEQPLPFTVLAIMPTLYASDF